MYPFSVAVKDVDFMWEVGDALALAVWRRRRGLSKRHLTVKFGRKYPKDMRPWMSKLFDAQYRAATVADTVDLEAMTREAIDSGWLRIGKEA